MGDLWVETGGNRFFRVWGNANDQTLALCSDGRNCWIAKADRLLPGVKVGEHVLPFYREFLGYGAYKNGGRCLFFVPGGTSRLLYSTGGFLVPWYYKRADGTEQGGSWWEAVGSAGIPVFPAGGLSGLSFSAVLQPAGKDSGGRDSLTVVYDYPRLVRTVSGLDSVAGEYDQAVDGWDGPSRMEVGNPRFSRNGQTFEMDVGRTRCGPARLIGGRWAIGSFVADKDLRTAKSSVTFSRQGEASIVWQYDGLTVGSQTRKVCLADFSRVVDA